MPDANSKSTSAGARWTRAAFGSLALWSLAFGPLSTSGVAAAKPSATSRQKISLPGTFGPGVSVSLSARRLSYRPGKCPPGAPCRAVLELQGAVRLKAGKLSVTARRLSVQLDKHGRPVTAAAEGATVRSGQVEGRARRVELSASAAGGVAGLVVVLAGDARLDVPRRGLRLAGARISFDTRTGAAVVHQARAELAR